MELKRDNKHSIKYCEECGAEVDTFFAGGNWGYVLYRHQKNAKYFCSYGCINRYKATHVSREKSDWWNYE